jgi:hypothetical protein
MTRKCQAIINRQKPRNETKIRWFQPPWRTVFWYECPECHHVHRMFANAFNGKKAIPGVGAIVCGNPIAEV